MPGARCARSLACKSRKHASKSPRSHRKHPAFPAQWFYGLFRALPGDRAFLPPSSPRSLLLENLTPASGRQDHMALPSASSAFVFGAIRVHRIPSRVRDDREAPLQWDETAREAEVICIGRERKYFCRGGLDSPNRIDPPQ
jgi:hypothetical protein